MDSPSVNDAYDPSVDDPSVDDLSVYDLSFRGVQGCLELVLSDPERGTGTAGVLSLSCFTILSQVLCFFFWSCCFDELSVMDKHSVMQYLEPLQFAKNRRMPSTRHTFCQQSQ